MSNADVQSASEQSWKQFYEAALRESRPEPASPKNCGRSESDWRMSLGLLRENGHNHSEKGALAGAHAVLDDLKRIHQPLTAPTGMQMGGRHERIGEKGLA
jgi:hypothetical protein